MYIYNVPIIQSDLRHEETIIQAVNSLEYLQNVILSVFERINTRIEVNANRISAINKRIDKANTEVGYLVGINKAINIFSCPKYPATHLFQNISITFKDSDKVNINYMDEEWHIKNPLDPVNHKNIHGKLQFYHVKGKNEPQIKMNKILLPPVGLGKLPLNIQSVNSLLMYNTDLNPYECYKHIDPLLNNYKRKQSSTNTLTDSELDAAPFSITHRKSVAHKQDLLLYAPSVRDAPELDLPVDLPDLPGVADDVIFDLSETDIGIRPSRREDPPPLDLPDITEITPTIAPNNVIPVSPPTIPEEVINAVSITNANSNVNVIPPPPPPPSALFNDANIEKTDTPKVEIKTLNVSNDDARSNLMEEIRKARGRTTRTTLEEKPNGEAKAKVQSPNDLMSDLHNKLAARRKGISGLKDGNNVASSISSLIPPPPPPVKLSSSQSNTEASDEDWE